MNDPPRMTQVSTDTLLTAENVHKSFVMGHETFHVLRGASLRVRSGEFVAITGASGSGKSTLMHILGTLDVPDEGAVCVDGENLFDWPAHRRDRFRCREVGFVFQFYHLLPELTLLENVLMPQLIERSVVNWFRHRGEARARAMEVIDRVGLADRMKHKPNELSGGERQRAAIARAVTNQPRILLADEPTGNLDAKTGKGVLDLLEEINQQGQTIVMVTHDEMPARYARRTLHLESGKLSA